MSFPNSAVDICNLSLDHLNEDSITAIDPPVTDVEVICARWYDIARRAALKRHTWNFAIKRAQLAKSGTDPLFGFDDAYDLPNDFVRFISIGTRGEIRNYQLEDNRILINAISVATSSSLDFLYIADFTNVGKMDALFIQVFALILALKMGMKITNNASLLAGINSLLEDEMSEAQTIDGQERPPIRVERSKFRRARRGAGRTVASPFTIFDEF